MVYPKLISLLFIHETFGVDKKGKYIFRYLCIVMPNVSEHDFKVFVTVNCPPLYLKNELEVKNCPFCLIRNKFDNSSACITLVLKPAYYSRKL